MSFLDDVRYGARILRKAPLFALGSVVVLALGIGSTTAMFSLVDAALIRTLPFRDSERLVMIWERLPQNARNRVAGLDFIDWTTDNRSFDVMGATMGLGGATAFSASNDDLPDAVPVQRVGVGYFEVLGIRPIAGRTFAADDVPAGADLRPGVVVDTAIISERLWRSRFGGDPSVVGRTIRLGTSGQPFRVIGIVPADFQVGNRADVWTPTPDLRLAARRVRFLQVIARLKPGVTIDQARADLESIADRIARDAPETNRGVGVTIEPLQQAVVGDELKTTTIVLAGVVTFVLLLACANIANLILVRGIGRTREIAVRAALGGSRGRIMRQLVAENLLLGASGGGAGLALSSIVLRAAPAFVPARTIPESVALGIDWRVSAFAVVLTLATAVLVGLAPAWHAVRIPLAEAMTIGGRGSTDRGGLMRNALATIEVAGALTLVIGAALFVRTLLSLTRHDAGYRADNVVTMYIARSGSAATDPQLPYFRTIEQSVAAVPGVRAIGLASDLPLEGQTSTMPFMIAGEPPVEQPFRPNAHYQIVTPGYFDVMGITVMRGRAFTDRDTATAVPVCIINEELARRYFSGRNPVGERIGVPSVTVRVPVEREVVGVIRQVTVQPGDLDKPLEIYVPFAQSPWTSAFVAVRTDVDPEAIVPSIKAAVARINRHQPVTRVRTMAQVAEESTARPRFRAQLITTFAVLAMMLAAVGISSVLMFSVEQRTRELGIRLALGATGRDLFMLIVSAGARLTAAGLAAGLLASLFLVTSLRSLLFAIAPFDPVAFAVAAAGVGAVSLAASVAPAIRAVRSDPAIALRAE